MASLADLTPEQLQALVVKVAALPPEQRVVAEAELQAFLRGQAWARGELRYKLHGNQTALYDILERDRPREFFALWTRRGGKSNFGIVRALETAIRTPNARILYLAPSAKQAKEIVSDQLPEILADCPKDLRPDGPNQANELSFRNGALIRFKGVNSERAEDLRGGAAHLVVFDEAGSMDRLEEVERGVVRPMTSTTKGTILFLTTPPNEPEHGAEKIYRRMEALERADGKRRTFRVTLAEAQNPRLDDEEKRSALLHAGERPEDVPRILAGEIPPRTITARREYFCEFISDAGQLVVPEYRDEASHIFIRPPPPPPYRDCYVGADWGVKDHTGVVFAYWDTRQQRLVVEGEWFEKQAGTPRLAAAIKEKEQALWGGNTDVYRVCDVDLRLQADLASLYGLRFALADKKDRAANIELLRSGVRRHSLIISPDCVNLDRQLRAAIHDRRGKDFERKRVKDGELVNPDDEVGHYDLVAALIYLYRYVHTRRKIDPAPPYGTPGSFEQAMTKIHPLRQKPKAALVDETPLARRLFGRRRRRY